MGRKIGTVLLILFVAILAIFGWRYVHYRRVNAVTDAAFIRSDRLATLSFKIGGRVIEMNASQNRPVRAGELLARLDPSDLQKDLEAARHRREALATKIDALKLKRKRLAQTLKLRAGISRTGVQAARDQIQALQARIDAARSRLAKLLKDQERYKTMLRERLISRSDYEKIRTAADAARHEIEAMTRQLDGLKSQERKASLAEGIARLDEQRVLELDKEISAAVEELKATDQTIGALKLKLGYTRLRAPFDGVIAKKFFDAPKVVKAGYPVYAVIDPTRLYCQVLLSEKKLRGVLPGNRATVTVDALDGKEFHGSVQSIAPTSASTFSLVPRDIASGEFTKLDQRFVVRIRLDDIRGLRAGMGATVAIRRR